MHKRLASERSSQRGSEGAELRSSGRQREAVAAPFTLKSRAVPKKDVKQIKIARDPVKIQRAGEISGQTR
jgi:hypothetical protein